ncbi:class I SAM-dependent methyltransferase [Labrenzia sp. DG1229]|uniref:class I SAM-dependent methyltransferase n=1 Tax=Labrenzia sp. DG1229 TaxID=681847 RepID=UPI00055F16B0|nr:class I SAM-dependent methyltransferase [Labrenzia sp. DG1229]
MTVVKEKIKARIMAEGPMSVAQYMATCLGDPDGGYYATRDPFGRDGDFITAPEVSQMFGELVGAACASAYQALGEPEQINLVEFGPGRGTLMADLLRVAALRPAFLKSASLHLIETSPHLRKKQQETLAKTPLQPAFLDTFLDVPDGPLIVVANEFFDALPIHQFIKTEHGWHERVIGLNDAGELTFGAGTARMPRSELPAGLAECPLGTIIETQPAANAIAQELGVRLARYGGAVLIVDYGYLKTAPGDTLQALYKHVYDDVLAHPGDADLTAHVNFEALATSAIKGGAKVHPPMTQGDFLLRSGLLERAGTLGAGKTHLEQESIRNEVERLAAPDQMGSLFKVLALTGENCPFPPFDSAD